MLGGNCRIGHHVQVRIEHRRYMNERRHDNDDRQHIGDVKREILFRVIARGHMNRETSKITPHAQTKHIFSISGKSNADLFLIDFETPLQCLPDLGVCKSLKTAMEDFMNIIR
jgi:hypothetical protein